MRRTFAITAALALLAVPGAAAGPFVTRSGTQLLLDGRPFRFGGANIEWLGVAGYGPFDPAGPHLPSHYEIDDALTTARELGADVVRSQTMGDSVGCGVCLEPALGQFNPEAFERVDYALRSARRRGIRIIATIVGDDARDGGSGCVYLRWRGIAPDGCSLVDMAPFWTDETVLHDVEQHIAALLNHVNVYTRVAYKNDPTILGWDLLNGGGSPTPWTRKIVRFVRSIDRNHLILSGPVNARVPGVDLCVNFVYPHWSLPYSLVRPLVAQCKAAGKPFAVYEYGWDRTNFATVGALRSFLGGLRADPEVVGDAFWALEAHAEGGGWLPIPADVTDPGAAAQAESGQWWALYYPGIDTLVTTAADMRARAEQIRRHNYAMRSLPLPSHPPPPAPTITALTRVAGAVAIRWQGSAGAAVYRVQRAPAAAGPWTTVCTCGEGEFTDRSATVPSGSWYRVVPYNVDGRAGPPSHASPLWG